MESFRERGTRYEEKIKLRNLVGIGKGEDLGGSRTKRLKPRVQKEELLIIDSMFIIFYIFNFI